jgi:hypothetical protein
MSVMDNTASLSDEDLAERRESHRVEWACW